MKTYTLTFACPQGINPDLRTHVQAYDLPSAILAMPPEFRDFDLLGVRLFKTRAKARKPRKPRGETKQTA